MGKERTVDGEKGEAGMGKRIWDFDGWLGHSEAVLQVATHWDFALLKM